MQEVSNILSRVRELSVQSANGTLSTGDRETLSLEASSLLEEVDRIATETEFNGIPLLQGGDPIGIQIGINSGERIDIAPQDTRAETLGLTGTDPIDLTTQVGASDALAVVDLAITSLNNSRGALGASQNRISSALRSIQSSRENLSAAESRIRDVDVASESAALTRNSILQQAAVSVLQQANTQPQIALSLLQG